MRQMRVKEDWGNVKVGIVPQEGKTNLALMSRLFRGLQTLSVRRYIEE